MPSIHDERVVDCPFSLAIDEASHFFHIVEGPLPDDARLPIRLFGLAFLMRRQVNTVGYRRRDLAERGRSHDEVAIAWKSGTLWLPDLRGSVRFRIESLKTRLLVDAAYVPPFGLAGVVFDRFAGRRIAEATIEDLTDRLQSRLESAWLDRRTSYTP